MISGTSVFPSAPKTKTFGRAVALMVGTSERERVVLTTERQNEEQDWVHSETYRFFFFGFLSNQFKNIGYLFS